MGLRYWTSAFVVCAASLSMCVACNKEDPNAANKGNEPPRQPEKIPDDFVVNDSFKEGKAFRPMAMDGGVDSGFLSGVGGGADPSAALVEAPVNERRMKVTNPGADPKVARRYTLKAASEDRRMVVNASISQEADGQRQGGDQPPITALLTFTGKTDHGDQKLEVVLKKIALAAPPSADKRIAAQQEASLKELAGLTIAMRLSARGSLGDPEMAQEKMPRAAQEILPILAQAFELVTVPFPEEPIGIGAMWEEDQVQKEQGGLEVATHTTYTLKDVKDGTLKVDVAIKRESKKVEVRAKQVPPGTTMQVTGEGKYSFETKLTTVASKVDGELVTIRSIEIPQGPKKIKQTEKATVKHALDTGKVP